ncbi:hypothetical protein K474DRAFT_1711463 [Panus rudis PR-1116 ss-1]|nr:hypothetical protein K474DRAFT_1711463 [Panus rudis PR-1116 ss-1]
MSNPKERHYWTQLRTVLTGGYWDASFPAKAPNGAPLTWSELLRKFNKHCTGYAEVAELASQTQALSLLVAANASDKGLEGNDVGSEGPLALGDECTLPEERIPEALNGLNTLQSLQSSKTESVRLALAYYVYALGRPSECLSLLAEAGDLTDVQRFVPTRASSTTLQVPSGSLTSSSSSWTGSFATTSTIPASSDISDGKAWATTECIRSICLKGMSHERISSTSPQVALQAYLTALPLLKSISTDIPCSLPANTSAASTDPGSFMRYRELWRWTERLLRRAIILSARIRDLSEATDAPDSIWALFNYYSACSAHWPPSFRPEHRSTVLVLHLRALILRARRSTPGKDKSRRWISTARSIIQEYRAILSLSTQFPRAGERNVKVEDFVDLCVAVWEADGAVGEYVGWVIDVLWWATRLTFNSYRVFRHMIRLLFVSGDPELAKRMLRLYVQVVSKAREARIAESDDVRNDASKNLGTGTDVDTDRNWVCTLVQGSRMLCRLALHESDYGKALDEAKEAGVMIEKAKTRLDTDDKELVAMVALGEGIWASTMAHAEQNPLTRTTRLNHALQLFNTAVGTYPSPSIHHHLALALSRPGPWQNLQEAIVHARSAVEGDSNEARHWHLLGLLLAATGDWRAAKAVLELGIEAAEADLSDDDDDVPASSTTEQHGNGTVNVKDYATVHGTAENGGDGDAASAQATPQHLGTVLDSETKEIPPSASLLLPPSDRPASTRYQRFEYALQTRMTLLALTEYVEGAEGVGEKWLEVFHWFREKRGVNVDDRRKSIDSRRVSLDTRPHSVLSGQGRPPTIMSQDEQTTGAHEKTPQPEMPTPIPITVTPASPGVLTPDFSQDPSFQDRLNGNSLEKRSNSLDEKDRDVSRGKKVKDALKTGVHKGQARISTISKKIGHGVGRRNSLSLKRSTSAPGEFGAIPYYVPERVKQTITVDFNSVLNHAPYQASSIHLRQYQSIHTSQQDLQLLEVPPPPPSPSPTPSDGQKSRRVAKDSRLLSDLWLMSAATFRRLGKIEQAKGAIQEAEVRDEDNPAVWVQLGLYYVALNNRQRAVESFRKALFLSPNDVSATIHLCRLYLSPRSDPSGSPKEQPPHRAEVDLAAGLLSDLTQGGGWDVPEAWYFLAKAYKLQGRRDRERECLSFSLALTESRGVRDIGVALGWCL